MIVYQPFFYSLEAIQDIIFQMPYFKNISGSIGVPLQNKNVTDRRLGVKKDDLCFYSKTKNM